MHGHDEDVHFSSSSMRINSSPHDHSLLANLQSCSKTLSSHLSNTRLSLTRMLDSLKNRHASPRLTQTRPVRRHNSPTQMLNSVTQLMIGSKSPLLSLSLTQSIWSDPGAERLSSPLLCCASLSLNRPSESSTQSVEGKDAIQQQQVQKGHSSASRNAEERVLISEVLVRTKDGEELERKDLEVEALAALKACRANSALTVREVQEDVHRIIESGYFCSCTPVAVDTRDGIRLMFQVEPNQEFRGLVCENANVLPSKFIQEAFQDGFGTPPLIWLAFSSSVRMYL
ncbi:hypothetical protein F2Q68_00022343 [Brassica cretica]|uniref:POTRA domain-containing protein n=1 Tax=Brassica cretica TaxID=69181 RepID=A0A8S9FUV0_BRACR|nr:hypothetical protein F2Q68_00022343 [Brassica cretica]